MRFWHGRRNCARALSLLGAQSNAEFAVRAKPHEFKRVGVRFSVDENEIRADVAIAAIAPLPAQLVIAEPLGQRLVLRDQSNNLGEPASTPRLRTRDGDELR